MLCVTSTLCKGPGPAEELRALLKELAAAGTFVRELDTGSVAYHSPMLGPVVAELRAGEVFDRFTWLILTARCTRA